MVYKFLVGSEEAENFKLEIMIDSEDTFMRLRNTKGKRRRKQLSEESAPQKSNKGIFAP